MVATGRDKRADLAVGSARNHHIARMERTAVDEHRGNRAATLVQVGLDNEAGSRCVGVGLELEDIGLEQDGFQQVVDVQAFLCGNVHEHVLATPFFGDDAVFGKLLANTVGRGAGLVDLVHGNHDGNLGGLRMVDCLYGLGHNAVVGGNHEHDYVGYLGAAGAHGGKRLVARGVDEGDLTVVDVYHGSTDVLGDAAGLAFGNAGVADSVKQRGLAVVYVAHDGNHGRARLQVFLGVVVNNRELFLGRDNANLAVQVVGDKLYQIVAHGLGKGKRAAQKEQALDNVVGGNIHQLGELGNRGALRDLDHRIVQDERGIETLLQSFLLGALTGLGLALFLALLAAALAVVGSGLYRSACLGEHLVTLELLGLNGHLGIAVFGLDGSAKLEFGNGRLEALALALLALAAAPVLLCSSRFLFLGLQTLLLGIDLVEQRREARSRGRGGLVLLLHRCLGSLGGLAAAVVESLLYGLLLGNLCSAGGGKRTLARLCLLALYTLALAFDLGSQALERRGRDLALGLFGIILGLGLFTASTFGLAGLALLFHGGTALGLFLGLALFFLRLGLGKLLGFLILELAGALLDLGLYALANLLHIGVLENAGMALGRDLHLCQPIEQLLAGHIKFFCQFMYSHARHMGLPSTYPRSRAQSAAAGRCARNHLLSTSF